MNEQTDPIADGTTSPNDLGIVFPKDPTPIDPSAGIPSGALNEQPEPKLSHEDVVFLISGMLRELIPLLFQ